MSNIRIHNHCLSDVIYTVITRVLLVFLVVIVLYPIYYVVVASFSDPMYVNSGELLLWPKGFTLLGYKRVFANSSIWIGYANTILYAGAGTVIGLIATIMAGYALSRSDLPGRRVISLLLIFTMYFSGGMIPTYLVVKSLGLVNSRFYMIICSCLSCYNIIVTRSFMESNIPRDLQDAAEIDGCGNGRFFVSIVVPLSKAVIAVIALYIVVAYWNSYFSAMLYLTDTNKYPLQLVLRNILLVASSAIDSTSETDPTAAIRLQQAAQLIKYAAIVVSTVPIICAYPFVQKYFVKGVMIGAVKG